MMILDVFTRIKQSYCTEQQTAFQELK